MENHEVLQVRALRPLQGQEQGWEHCREPAYCILSEDL